LNKKFWIIHGARYKKDLFWNPSIKNTNLDIEYVPVLSRENENWKGAKGYVQHIVLNKQIDLSDSQVYACGSNEMIESAKNLLCCSGLEEINFFSDAFIQTN
jgi:CDP-4-dehydro-6-deoxyglucose reductase